MTWVKICGITNLEDARTAVDAGADALGFVFYEKSLRRIEVEAARDIVAKLPGKVEKVGVFVGGDTEHIRKVVSDTGVTAVQLHGEQALDSVWRDPRPAEECVGTAKFIPVIAADSLKGGGVLISEPVHQKIFAVLVDSRSNGRTGGTGITFDWEATRGMVQSLGLLVPVIVAGGLTASNVGDALRLFEPWGVDVASGVEARPGKKDPEKVRAFVQVVRAAEKTI